MSSSNSTSVLRDLERKSIQVKGSLIGWVLQKGQPVVTLKISDDPRSFALQSRKRPLRMQLIEG